MADEPIRVTTGPDDIGPSDLPRDERGRRAWDFVCYKSVGCRDKQAAIDLALASADETLVETIQLRQEVLLLRKTLDLALGNPGWTESQCAGAARQALEKEVTL